VGRYEDLVDDLIHVLTVLDQTFEVDILHKLDPVNVSRKSCGEPVWAPELKLQMLALEAPAIRRFYPERIDPSRTLREYPTSTAGPQIRCQERMALGLEVTSYSLTSYSSSTQITRCTYIRYRIGLRNTGFMVQ
jgi:hypothetical protein